MTKFSKMNYNIYQLLDDFEINPVLNSDLNSEIKVRLRTIEKEIVKEFLKKQEGKLGIKNLGNEIRYNSILKKEFNNSINKKVIVKMTENRRSFIKVFLSNWFVHDNSEIYYLILESSFGNDSRIVDSSFIRINEIREELKEFNSFFRKTTIGPKIYFIELKGLSDHHIIDNEGYSILQK